jgi:hypothetical protein
MLGRVLAELGYDWKVEEAVPIIERIKMNFGRADERFGRGHFMPPTRTRWNAMQDRLPGYVAARRRADAERGHYTLSVLDLLVDEFQDTDPLQFRWVELHARAGTHVTVVGDDDQSIYGFRAALGFGEWRDSRARLRRSAWSREQLSLPGGDFGGR